MDLACGTGKIYFETLSHFSGICLATDRSSKQLETVQKKLANSPDAKRFPILECDCYDIASK